MAILDKLMCIVLAVHFMNCQTFAQNSTDDYKLIIAHVINRHGDRNIKNTFPNDRYKDEQFWKNGYAELSNIGKREQYELGKYLRSRYSKLIGAQYSPDKVYIQCSDVNRNLMSAECVAAGLFPPSGDEVWNENLKWQPIPVHTIDFDKDNLLSSRVKCSAYHKFEKECNHDERIAGIVEQHRGFIQSLEYHSGQELPDAHELSKFFDILQVEDRRGFVLPGWAYTALKANNTLNYLGSLGYQSQTCSKEMKKIRAGFLIKEMLDRFKEKLMKPHKVSEILWIYGTQATIVVSVLNTLNVFDNLIPPFSSTILFELYQRDDEFYVQVTYRTTVSEDHPALEIPNCGKMCPLDKFYDLYKDILPNDDETFKSMCREEDEEEDNEEEGKPEKQPTHLEYINYIILTTSLITVALAIIILIVLWKKCQRNNKSQSKDILPA